MSNFCEKLRSCRKERGLTTTAAAVALGVTQPAWNQWELGLREPKLDVLVKIANLLDCSADWLLGLKDRGTSSAVASGSGAIAVAGSGNKVSIKNKGAEPKDCAKCPYRKKLEKLEKMIAK